MSLESYQETYTKWEEADTNTYDVYGWQYRHPIRKIIQKRIRRKKIRTWLYSDGQVQGMWNWEYDWFRDVV